ncbi:MAG TPA: hypothetical protein VIU61_05965 [Kofleriaceae bacterium]
MAAARHYLRVALVLGLAGLVGCPDDEFATSTWTKKLGGREHERAVKELEALGDPSAIPALGKAYVDQGKQVRDLQVIISLARPLTPKQAADAFYEDFQKTGRPASWDKASPYLQKALQNVDENNPRSVDGAAKAADALAEARVSDALPALIEFASTCCGDDKKVTKKTIAAVIQALKAIGKYDSPNDKPVAAAALAKLIERNPPDHPRTAKDDQKKQYEERYTIYLGVSKFAIAALGELRTPAAVKTLIPALYRTPELYSDIRRALVASGPSAKEELQKILRGEHQAVNQIFTDKKLDKYCGDKGDLPADQCQAVSLKDFYPADVLGDFYDPATVKDLLTALKRPAAPVFFQEDNASPNTQYNAIFNALKKIGSAEAAPTVRSMWMAGKPAKGQQPPDTGVRIMAVNAYAFVTRDLNGVDELGKIAADNGADDVLRQESALAFARISSDRKHISILEALSTKYKEASKTKQGELTGKVKTDKEAADKELEAAKAASKAYVEKIAADKSSTAKQITDATKKAEEDVKVAKKKHKEKVAPYRITEDAVKAYKMYSRLFETHIARIAIAIKCGGESDKNKCWANTLNMKTADAVAIMKSYVKDVDSWTKDEQLGLLEGMVERGLLELGKAGPAASSYTEALLDNVAKSENRLIRQSILLALPKIAKVPCNTCEAKLDVAIKSGEGKTTLQELNSETLMLRHYFSWAGGKTPTPMPAPGAVDAPAPAKAEKAEEEKPTPTEKAPEEKPAEPAKAEEKPAEKPAEKKPAEKPAKKKKGRR